jgi:hypothetical protein
VSLRDYDMNHCLIFDIGKTNKKAFVFDEAYHIVVEKSTQIPETIDDDGDPCEDIEALRIWIIDTLTEIMQRTDLHIVTRNCTTYGASFVHINENRQLVAPLYNYLKPFPEELMVWFLNTYGPRERISLSTASPLLGHLNSGLQLLWLKHHKPLIFNKIRYSLHLPQWVYSLVRPTHFNIHRNGDMTSIGCHTMLWDYPKNNYADWVYAEGIDKKLSVTNSQPDVFGLHDSSAALIPYLTCFEAPFLLISTGTWCITLNPFNDEPLTPEELAQDCLLFMTKEGKSVKAARYFGGHEHDEGVKKIAVQYNLSIDFYKTINYNPSNEPEWQAYHNLMGIITAKTAASARLALGKSNIKQIFVDGGFSNNQLFMRLLAAQFPNMAVYAAEVPQATAIGVAMAIHHEWNTRPINKKLINLKKY